MIATTKWTESDIAAIAAEQKCSLEQLQRRWVIQRGSSYYVMGPTGQYQSPIGRSELPQSLPRDLIRVPSTKSSAAGIDWFKQRDDASVPKTVDEILEKHNTVARKAIVNMSLPISFYDDGLESGEEPIFYERACPLRKLEPTYDLQVDTWLRLLGGKDSEKLLDWIAVITYLSKVSCGLYLHAEKDCGKTLFANGMARLWGDMPTELESTIGDFNSAILNCPLIFADEEVPKKMTSGFLRRSIGSTTRPLRRKNIPEASLLGAIRLIIAANTPDLLKFDSEDFHVDDIDAIAARILYIHCNAGAAAYLRSIGGRKGTEGWLENGDKIARHALWLRDNRKVELGSRFLVEGEVEAIHRRLVTHGSIRGLVIEWICRALLTKWVDKYPGIRFGGGDLYINASFVKQNWTRIVDDMHVPSLSKIGRALKPMAVEEKRMRLGDRRADFYKINVKHVYETARDLQLGTVEEYVKLIDAPGAFLDTVEDTNEPPPPPASAEPLPPNLATIVGGGSKSSEGSLLDRSPRP